MSDPMKEMAQQLDARIVAAGGQSIYGFHRRPVVVAIRDGYEKPSEEIARRLETRRLSIAARFRRINGRAPQRIMGHTYGILGAGVLSDFDEMGW